MEGCGCRKDRGSQGPVERVTYGCTGKHEPVLRLIEARLSINESLDWYVLRAARGTCMTTGLSTAEILDSRRPGRETPEACHRITRMNCFGVVQVCRVSDALSGINGSPVDPGRDGHGDASLIVNKGD